MKLTSTSIASQLGGTLDLSKRFFSPLCGIGTRSGAFISGKDEANIMCVGGQIAGVHYLLDRPAPKNSYHVGGSGILEFEAMIKTIAESIERYSQLMAGVKFNKEIRWASFRELKDQNEPVIDIEKIRYFTPEQFEDPDFPFSNFDLDSKFGFIKVDSFFSGESTWVPAQLLFIGYNVRKHDDEPWILPAVTTGTATHTDPEKCLRNAILELIQLDSTMGHWYGSVEAIKIELDERVKNLSAYLKKLLPQKSYIPHFYLLPNPDLDGFTVACLLESPNSVPGAVVGLGSDTSLESSMNKAFIEAASCYQLAKFVTFQEFYPLGGKKTETEISTSQIYDLDQNVFYYSLLKNSGKLKERFDSGSSATASELPPDMRGNTVEQITQLVGSYKRSGKELYFTDLTTQDVAELGFMSYRVWSPDSLSLSIPSTPTLAHKRYKDYNGIKHVDIHPYP